jgi:hypothetical protein
MIKHEAKYPVPPVTHTVPLSPSISLSLSNEFEWNCGGESSSLSGSYSYIWKETCQLLFLSFFINVVSTSLFFFFWSNVRSQLLFLIFKSGYLLTFTMKLPNKKNFSSNTQLLVLHKRFNLGVLFNS